MPAAALKPQKEFCMKNTRMSLWVVSMLVIPVIMGCSRGTSGTSEDGVSSSIMTEAALNGTWNIIESRMGGSPNEPADPNTFWIKFDNGAFEYGSIVGVGPLSRGTYTVKSPAITLVFIDGQTYNGKIIDDTKIELSFLFGGLHTGTFTRK